ncbi:DUF4271 domain-containing protein [Winogradskyella haliclonae]|uniref:DUF4271 domain-containing protein n=1 Tax=Winogradskyella haliclonae TaxID=2048558 RepID=A0ABQ2BWG7_9FLAO|nr:DUF4271 domain-containing protein [Winogradskyella haliclonae]GGI55902.1 DUF4271 domain-containing protein [Winogradskyella haliclonae]
MLREYFTQDIYIGLILVCLILIVSTRQLFGIRFADFLQVIWNDRYIKLYSRERKKLDIFNILLFTNFVFTLGIFIHFAYSTLKEPLPDNIFLLIYVFLGLLVFTLFKIIIERIIAHVCEFSEFIKEYIFQKNTYKNISGLLLLLVNILLLFSDLDKKIVIYSSLTLFLLINVSGFIRFLQHYQKAIISNFFYFLLYLCALEIGPYVILYKVFKDYFG